MREFFSFAGLEQIFGALLITVVMLDVFLTVLYARARIGIISRLISAVTWRLFRAVSVPFGEYRASVISLCGPAILALVVGVWAFALCLGAALIIHPALGTSVTASSGATPTDFITALFAGGGSMAIVGASNFTPQTTAFRLLYLFNSVAGMCVVSLTLTYLLQVYAALQRRNSAALNFHLASAETGDAAELVAGLGARGNFDNGYTDLSQMATIMTQIKESHHFYPVLLFFRFREARYSASRFALVALDSVTLIKSALDDEKYEWLKESLSATQLWRASILLLETLAENFLSADENPAEKQFGEETRERWRRRYFAAVRRLKQAG
ncbi:MAG TPA: hypothetical protein VF692_10870, partial [Pyrinomonadaceae bacterium]